MKKKLAIAADHAGFELKQILLSTLAPTIDWVDLGPASADRVDYPDYAEKAAAAVLSGSVTGAVLICGSGIGMSIAANKVRGIRAAHSESVESAKLSKEHNNAQILCIGARLTPPQTASQMVTAWANTTFEGGRHSDRINKITSLESALLSED